MGNFAVIDTETNWNDRVMSIGVVIASEENFKALDGKYYVLFPEYTVGGMFVNELFDVREDRTVECNREKALCDIVNYLKKYNVGSIFAYNACFDKKHLPELGGFRWYDIMRLAAYSQYNPCINPADCCSTGRLKRNYGVEPMLNLLRGRGVYRETHNALFDAFDELEIMKLLNVNLNECIPL